MTLLDYFVRVKVYAQRGLIYVQIIQFFLIVYLSLSNFTSSPLIMALLVIACLFGIILIGKYERKLKVLEKEQGYYHSENKDLKRIEDLLLELKNGRNNCRCVSDDKCDCISDIRR